MSCNKQCIQVKADLEPDIDPQTLKEETAEWIRTHKDADGNIKKQ